MAKEVQLIQLSFPPDYIKKYCEKLVKDAENEKNMPEMQKRMMRDIDKLVGVAVGVMRRYASPAEKENTNQKS